MDRLWTPWRYNYLSSAGQEGSCVFCRILAQASDVENFVLFRGGAAFVLLNLFPYTSGHLLAVANRHISFLGDASAEELNEIIGLGKLCEKALRSEYHPDGFNLGFNLGRAAGAGVAHHLHMHVLPRWVGDSNFVSTVAETRVLPEELPSTYRRLLPHFKAPQPALS
jgi:ATP adenylyltransferase